MLVCRGLVGLSRNILFATKQPLAKAGDFKMMLQIVFRGYDIEAAMTWIRYATQSAKYVFISASDEAKMMQIGEIAHRIVGFLDRRIRASRSEIMVECFQGHESKANIDAAIERLLNSRQELAYS